MGDASILRSMETLLTVKLRHSKYGKPEYIQSMMEEFRSSIDQYTDLSPFPFMIKFGLPKHDDPVVGIQKGRLTLSKLVRFYWRPDFFLVVHSDFGLAVRNFVRCSDRLLKF